MSAQPRSRAGFIFVGLFLFFAASMASFAGLTLIFPGSILDRAWAINPRAYSRLAPLGGFVGIPFLLLAGGLAIAGFGWFRQRLWAWRLTVVIISLQILGDAVNAFTGDFIGGSVGFLIAAALLFYLARPAMRSVFAK